VVLPALPGMGAWRNTETQQSNHASKSGPEVKMKKVTPKMERMWFYFFFDTLEFKNTVYKVELLFFINLFFITHGDRNLLTQLL